MRTSTYNEVKLAIFEKETAGLISESQRDELLQVLEEKKAATELTPDSIQEIFEELAEMYPDLEKDITALAKKLEKAGGSESSDDDSDDGEEVSEAALDLFEMISNM